MMYYLRLWAVMADVAYCEAYWDAVALSDAWLAFLTRDLSDDS
jgi:hypothetical protein